MKNRAPLWSSNYTTRYLPKGYKNADMKEHMHPDIHSCIINSSQIMKRAKMSIDRWIDKEDVVYIYTMEYYSAIRNDEYPPHASMWMELKGIMLS